MTGTATISRFATWTAPGFPFRIESAPEVLEQIRLAAVEGYHRVPRGGVEIGGVLYGTRSKNAVRIKAWRPVACAYAKGPSFLLSEQEESALSDALKSYSDDPELANLEPVGWCRAHTRSEILLADSDLAFYNRFFPQPWQIGLIVRPASFGPTRAGFFFREPDGHIRTQSSYREFTLAPTVTRPQRPIDAPLSPTPAPATPEPAPLAPEPPPPPVTAAPIPRPAPPEPRPVLTLQAPTISARPRRRLPRYVPVTVIALAVAILAFLLWPSHQALSLAATDLHGQLRISWDRTSRTVRRATGGSLDIDDHGFDTPLKLTPADLRVGSVFYEPQSGDVTVRLRVDVPGGSYVAETVRFIRAGPIASVIPAPQPVAVPHPKPAAPRVAQPLPVAPRPASPPPSTPSPTPARPEAPLRPVIVFHEPQEAPPKQSAGLPAIPPPSIANSPASPPTGLASVISTPTAPAPVPHAPRGRIIWTGKLSRNGRLIIERNHASAGSIVGGLPASAAHVTALPGDLTAAGMTLYTADPRYAQSATEQAGPDNGWNSTTYTYDPKRAAGIRIEEQPSPQNGFRLVLQCDVAKLSVLMIEWRAP